MSKKRILLAGLKFQGGLDSVVGSLREKLEDRGHTVDVLYHPFMPPYQLETSSGSARTLGSQEEMLRNVDWRKYDAIHIHAGNFNGYEYQGIERASPKAAKIYTAHSVIIDDVLRKPDNIEFARLLASLPADEKMKVIDERIKREYIPSLQRGLFESSDRLVFLTETQKRLFEEHYPELSGRPRLVIGNFSDFAKYDTDAGVAEEAFRIQDYMNGRIMLFVGRVEKDKGVADLATAFNNLAGIYGDLRLVIAGDGDRNLVLDRIADEHKGKVWISGWLTDKRALASYYRAATATVIPSYYESFGLAAVESMMLGTPVIISDVGGPRELFVQPQLAYNMTPGDVQGLQTMIYYLLETQPDFVKANAENVKRAAQERFSPEGVVDKIEALYDITGFERKLANWRKKFSLRELRRAEEIVSKYPDIGVSADNYLDFAQAALNNGFFGRNARRHLASGFSARYQREQKRR